MRILGLDVGEKTIGLAVSDPLGWTAQGLYTIRRKGMRNDLEELKQVMEKYDIETFVIGLPLNMNGSEGPSSMRARELAAAITGIWPDVEIVFKDERLSTVFAEKILIEGNVSRNKRKQVIDKMAAVYILQGHLDRINTKN